MAHPMRLTIIVILSIRFPYSLARILVIFTKLLADNDGSSVGKTTTGDRTNIYHHDSNCICGNHIIANVAKDRCER